MANYSSRIEDHFSRLSCIKNTLLVMHLIFILILVVTIITSVILHGINPTLFLLTIFDLNSVVQLSDKLQNNLDTLIFNGNETLTTTASYIAINSPTSEFLFVALTLYIVAIFNQVLSLVAILRRQLCIIVFGLLVNLVIFCVSVTFIKTNLFLILITLIMTTVFYTIALKQAKQRHHLLPDTEIHNHNTQTYHHSQQQQNPSNLPPNTSNLQQNTHQLDPSNLYQSVNDPKILAPIIYCPHYTESVC